MAQKQATRTNQAITLKGSTALVTEFFEYGVNSILYQRGVYPSDDFRMVKKYGIPLLITADESLKEYLQTVLSQVQEWLMTSSITRLVLAIKSLETDETLERWQFDIQTDEAAIAASGAGTGSGSGKASSSSASASKVAGSSSSAAGAGAGATGAKKKDKTEKEVQGEIREIMKQITSSVTFLPILEDACTFTLLAYTNTDSETAIPNTWGDADPHLIDRGKVEQVRLRSFSTNVHSLEAMVAYRVGE